ncbi:MAG: magnesium transporter [Anaerolineales bacterium]|nr:magnesium transporter [Anaerolineales bacterium]
MPNTQNLYETLRTHLQTGNLSGLRRLLKKQYPADLAEALEHLPAAQRNLVFGLLSPADQAEVLHELGPQAVRSVLDELPVAKAAAILNLLPMDEAAHAVGVLQRRRAAILAALAPRQRGDVQRLLSFPAESAGQMMTEQFARLDPQMTASQALAHLRKISPKVETLTNLYVVDGADGLLGVLSLRELVTAAPTTKIARLMNREVISVLPETDREEVAKLLSRYDFLAIPVADAEKRILGIITADDVIDVLAAEHAEDLLKFGAVQSGVEAEAYFSVPVWTVVTRRVGWLLLLFVAGTLTASVLQFFEKELAAVVALSFFIPLLIGTGGNTGAQTVSTLIRGLATGELHMQHMGRIIQRELLTGLILGTLLGLVAYGRALLWSPEPDLALAVGLGVLTICVWANGIAAFIPLLAKHFKIDPAAVSAPLITTLVDATGLAIYLVIAKLTLNI